MLTSKLWPSIFLSLLLTTSSSQASSISKDWTLTGLGLGLGYSTYFQEHQIEFLTRYEPTQLGMSLHLGQAFFDDTGMRGAFAFNLSTKIKSIAAGTRWFLWEGFPLYLQGGSGLFFADGSVTSFKFDMITGAESQTSAFSMAGPFIFSHVGLAFIFFRRYYMDFAVRGVGKAWALYTHGHQKGDSSEALADTNRDLAKSNLSVPKTYGIFNFKFGMLL